MNRYTLRSVWIFLLLFVVVVVVAESRGRPGGWSDTIDLIIDVRAAIQQQFVGEVDERELMEAAARSMLQSLGDPHTTFIPAADLVRWDEQVEGSFSGIGATVELKNNRIHIIYPFDNSPAARSGIQPGDAILEIDGVDTLGMDLLEATGRLKGPEGTEVVVRVRHASGEEVEMTITRGNIVVPTIRGLFRDGVRPDLMLDHDSRIAYVRLDQFNRNSAADLRAALQQLEPLNPRGLILDLRFNPGGLLDAAVEISSLFLPRGSPVVSVRGRATRETVYRASNGNLFPDLPVVVLVNEGSASASEIVAGALKDNDRAWIVGSRTFGKGSVQNLQNLGHGRGAVKLTIAHYHLPGGRNIHRKPDSEVWGVDPHDGAYIALTPTEIRHMLESRRAMDSGLAQDVPDRITPEWLRSTMRDPQLAGAVEALLGRLEDGTWPEVGSKVSREITQLSERENLLRQRESAMELVERIDAQLRRMDRPEVDEPSDEPLSEQPSDEPGEQGGLAEPDLDGSLEPEMQHEPALP